MTTQVERLTRVEVEVQALRDEVTELKSDIKELNSKIDDLLALKYKGQGMFLLASAIFGTSIIGTLTLIMSWFRN